MLQKLFSQLGGWLNQLLSSAEDPRETFSSTYQRQRDLLLKVQKALADIMISKDVLQTKMLVVKGKLPQLEAQAREALRSDRDDLARLALQRQQIASAELLMLEMQVREIQQEEQQLALTEQRLSAQIEAFFTHQEIVVTQFNAAEAQVRVNEALSGVSRELADLGVALKVAEEKTEYMQARASAIDSLIDDGILRLPRLPGSDYRQPNQFEVAQAVEEKLAALKREMGADRESAP